MSQPYEPTHEDGSDSVAVEPVSITTELAEKAEDLLRDFAEEAELSMALIINRDTSLIAGISSEENVAVEEISALVTGASSAVKALVHELGERGAVESLHQGADRIVYLHDLLGRFILVGVSATGLPIGIIRQQAVPVRAKLTELLKDVEGAAESEPPEQAQRSLRISGLLRDPQEEALEEKIIEQQEEPEPEEEKITIEKDPIAEDQAPTEAETEEEAEPPRPIEDPPEDVVESEEDEIIVEDEVVDMAEAPPVTEDDEGDSEPAPNAENTEPEDTAKVPLRPATIVVDSPFEAVIETAEEEIIELEETPAVVDDWGGAEEEIEIVDEAEPETEVPQPPVSSESTEVPPPPAPIAEPPPEVADDNQTEEESDDEPAPRKAGPKYSFDLG